MALGTLTLSSPSSLSTPGVILVVRGSVPRMALEAHSLTLRCRLNCRTQRLPIASLRRSIVTISKMRNKNFSSRKRQQLNRASQEELPENTESQLYSNNDGESPEANSASFSKTGEMSQSNHDDEDDINRKRNGAVSSAEETNNVIGSAPGAAHGESLALEQDALRREISLMKNDIQNLKLKVTDAGETERRVFSVEKQCSLLDVSLKELQSQSATPLENVPCEFWSRLLLLIDGWLLEKKILPADAKSLRELTWKKDVRIHDAYLACRSKSEHEKLATFLKVTSSYTSVGLQIIHIAAEMAPVAKVGGLGDVVSGLCKALQKKGHLVEIVIPKYDCMQCDLVPDLKVLDVELQSYFDGRLFKNKVWVGTVEGLPVYFIEPHHPDKFFWRGKYYGEHDDFRRFSFFSRAALELLVQSGKKPDIIHCHDWLTGFVAPLYWEIYAKAGLNSARICFTCHNFEHQGSAPASELASCGLVVHRMNRPDRMQDNVACHRVNAVKGAIVYSNVVTTVSPTYAQEVCTAEGGRGLHVTLQSFSKKFVGILNGIDTDVWNPSTDKHIGFQYSADDLCGKAKNKDAIRKHLKLCLSEGSRPLVACITRLVPQKGVHLIRHAIYHVQGIGGQFVLLGESPVPQIQREFEDIAKNFQSHPHVRLLVKYDEALSHLIYAASDMLVIPSMSEPCGLTQMIAMRYGSVPIARKTGGLNDSVFDIDDDKIPEKFKNGFTFVTADDQGLRSAMNRAFLYYNERPKTWEDLVQRGMRTDFSWDSSASQYDELYQKTVQRARASASRV